MSAYCTVATCVLSMLTALALTHTPALAQGGTIQGRVRDDDGAAVSGVRVTVLSGNNPIAGAYTDQLGSYRISTVPAGTYTLNVSGLGYVEHTENLLLGPGETIQAYVRLERGPIELEGIFVETEASRERTRFEQTGGVTVRELNLPQLRAIPGLAEADPVRAIEVLPGVVSTSDFSAAFHVRGGSQDQNLILLDGVPVFSPFHLGGLFSVFNADMLDRVELQSGGFAAKHGGRVSSVLEIESDAGEGPFGVDAGISLLATRVAAGVGWRWRRQAETARSSAGRSATQAAPLMPSTPAPELDRKRSRALQYPISCFGAALVLRRADETGLRFPLSHAGPPVIHRGLDPLR